MNKFTLVAASAALILAACGETAQVETAPVAETTPEVVTPAVQQLADGMYTVDAAACEVVWIGRKVTGEHRGNIAISSGDFKVYGGAIVGGTINVDMTSMTNTDLDAESGAKLLGHLASDDFFGTAQHPTATLSIETYVPAENGGTVKGMMTIKGISKPVSFDVIANPTEGGLELRGMMKVNRTEYEIKYGSGTFIENLGDKAIDDIFELGFFVVAKS